MPNIGTPLNNSESINTMSNQGTHMHHEDTPNKKILKKQQRHTHETQENQANQLQKHENNEQPR